MLQAKGSAQATCIFFFFFNLSGHVFACFPAEWLFFSSPISGRCFCLEEVVCL